MDEPGKSWDGLERKNGTMNGHGYSSPHGRRAYGSQQHFGHNPYDHYETRPKMAETTLRESEIAIERKLFTLALKENPKGRFLRVVEGGEAKFS